MEPTVPMLRKMILATVAAAILSMVVTFALPNLVPDIVRLADEQAASDLPPWLMTANLLFIVAYTIAGIFGLVGLYRLRRWAPQFNLWITILGFAVWLILDYSVTSGLAAALSDFSTTVWGAVLALVFFTPLRNEFKTGG